MAQARAAVEDGATRFREGEALISALRRPRAREVGTDAGRTALPSSQRRAAPRSHLLAAMTVVTLVMLLLLGVALATLASAHVAASAITAAAAADRSLAAALLEELGPLAVREPASVAEANQARRALEAAVSDVGLLGVALLGPDGARWAAAGADGLNDLGPAVADRPPADRTASSVVQVASAEGPLLVETFPALLDGDVAATLVLVREGSTVAATAAAAQRDIAVTALIGSSVVVAVVLLVFRGAQRRLDEQTRSLIEAERRDPLTGCLTHGAALAELTAAMDDGVERIAVALVDIDNFRQLNETHGHDLGDSVIRRVASTLVAAVEQPVALGRSGPDEFLIVCPGADARSLGERLDLARRELFDAGIDTRAGDALPLGISAGIAVSPLHGRTPTELVSAAALTLGEAKSGGGDRVLVSRLSYADLVVEHRATFTILDGLVNAIDARDRYTRRHSDDVARYALFLAQQFGLDESFRGALHHAALLHDVGKIAVPDDILRKPAGLTDAEMEVMKQHVLLGGVLVRDMSAAELVAEGVRHHHERWDGTGYPDGLAGEAIPLIARVIAVADAYSAMTTTRPYRRALSPGAALGRLTAAAGTQLDPRLVDVFVLAMERAAEPPLPSDSRAPAAWLVEGTAA